MTGQPRRLSWDEPAPADLVESWAAEQEFPPARLSSHGVWMYPFVADDGAIRWCTIPGREDEDQ